MKSSNYYKRLALAILLMLALLVTFVACDSGTGRDDPTGGSSDETTGSTDPSNTSSGVGGADSGSAGGDETSGNAGGAETGGSSSGGSETSGNADESQGGSSSGETVTVTYTVTVVDGAGDPIKNVLVKLSDGSKQAATNSSGVATLKAGAEVYTFTLEMIGGGSAEYLYNAAACVLSPSAPSVTVSFVERASTEGDVGGATDGEPLGDTISADPDGDGTRADYFAPYVTTGSVAVKLVANDMTYVLFRPEVAGQYRFSATSSTATVSVGYYGVPAFVQTNNVAEVSSTSQFELNVRAGSIGTPETGTLTVVVGLKATNGSAGDAILTIERFADPITDISDVPFKEIQPESEYLKETPAVSGTLTDIDITKEDIVIVKGSDGYYHYGSESGPIVMLRLSTASPYIDSFVQIGDCQSLAYFEYDSSGALLRKERWNAVVTAFAAYANGDGVVPLNDQLITMLQDVGTHMGWWDPDHPQYLFEEVGEVTKNAYLFACCYYA